ncbi:hypothetical protein DQ04_08971000 [Trypanosoma grayi]|uniref:hypothetical protein n=1 Tax=Trypanosoma grayi TaxID=71804 RepID=UPI0004F4847C|nr:hypothetical protein DQ04_08971000 [Trypanosoma grayi]KEG07726.1 hypothetical protein DQ04_08971000 [Trypanosoma grayi]
MARCSLRDDGAEVREHGCVRGGPPPPPKPLPEVAVAETAVAAATDVRVKERKVQLLSVGSGAAQRPSQNSEPVGRLSTSLSLCRTPPLPPPPPPLVAGSKSGPQYSSANGLFSRSYSNTECTKAQRSHRDHIASALFAKEKTTETAGAHCSLSGSRQQKPDDEVEDMQRVVGAYNGKQMESQLPLSLDTITRAAPPILSFPRFSYSESSLLLFPGNHRRLSNVSVDLSRRDSGNPNHSDHSADECSYRHGGRSLRSDGQPSINDSRIVRPGTCCTLSSNHRHREVQLLTSQQETPDRKPKWPEPAPEEALRDAGGRLDGINTEMKPRRNTADAVRVHRSSTSHKSQVQTSLWQCRDKKGEEQGERRKGNNIGCVRSVPKRGEGHSGKMSKKAGVPMVMVAPLMSLSPTEQQMPQSKCGVYNKSDKNNRNTKNNVALGRVVGRLKFDPSGDSSTDMLFCSSVSSMGAVAFASGVLDGPQGRPSLRSPRTRSSSCNVGGERSCPHTIERSLSLSYICLPNTCLDTSLSISSSSQRSASSVTRKAGSVVRPQTPLTNAGMPQDVLMDALFHVVDVPVEMRLRPEQLMDAARVSLPLPEPAVLVSSPLNFTIQSDAMQSPNMHGALREKDLGGDSDTNNDMKGRNFGDSHCKGIDDYTEEGFGGGGHLRFGIPYHFNERPWGSLGAAAAAPSTSSAALCEVMSSLRRSSSPLPSWMHRREYSRLRDVGFMLTPRRHDRARRLPHKEEGGLLEVCDCVWSPHPADALTCSSGAVEMLLRSGRATPWDAHSCSETLMSTSCLRRQVSGAPLLVGHCTFEMPTFGSCSVSKT